MGGAQGCSSLISASFPSPFHLVTSFTSVVAWPCSISRLKGKSISSLNLQVILNDQILFSDFPSFPYNVLPLSISSYYRRSFQEHWFWTKLQVVMKILLLSPSLYHLNWLMIDQIKFRFLQLFPPVPPSPPLIMIVLPLFMLDLLLNSSVDIEMELKSTSWASFLFLIFNCVLLKKYSLEKFHLTIG